MGPRDHRRRRRGSSGRPPRRREGLIYGGLTLIVVVSVLLIGSVHWLVVAALGALSLLAMALAHRELQAAWNPLSTIFALLALWSMVQAIPLPLGLLRAISPALFDIWNRALLPYGESPPAWVTLSVDPTATWLEVLKWSTYAGIAAFGAQVARERSLNAVLAIIWGSATMVAIVTVLQAVSGADTVLGIYTPISARPDAVLSVLINPNNLSGYANLGVFAGLGLIVSRRQFVPRPLAVAGVAMCLATTILSASRAGNAFLLAGIIGLVAQWSTRTGQARGHGSALRVVWTVAPVLSVVLLGFVLAMLGGTQATWTELFADDLTKLEEVPRLLPALKTHWGLGVGRGAFESVSMRYFLDGRSIVRHHIENFAMSWMVEWGAVVATAALAAFAWRLRPAHLVLGRHRPAQAAFAGALVLIAQNLLDLGLENFSLGIALAALLGALEGSRDERIDAETLAAEQTPGRFAAWRKLSLGVPALGIASALLALHLGPDVYAVNRSLEAAYRKADLTTPAAFAQMKKRLARENRKRPAEPHFAIMGAVGAVLSQNDALPFASAAIERAPHYGRAHFLAAEALAQRGATEQAMLQLKLAAEADRSLVARAARRALTWTDDAELLQEGSPDGENAAGYLLQLRAAMHARQRPVAARGLLQEALKRAPGDLAVLANLSEALLTDLRRGSQPCWVSADDANANSDDAADSDAKSSANNAEADDGGAQDNDVEDASQDSDSQGGPKSEGFCPLNSNEVTERIQRIQTLATKLKDSPTCDGLRTRAKLLAYQEKHDDAVDLLAECSSCSAPAPCARDRAGLAQKLDDTKKRREAEQAYIGQACRDSESCARAESHVGSWASRRGDHLSAYSHYARAASRDPSAKNWLATARAAARAGRIANAESAYAQAKKLGATDAQVEALLSNARRATINNLLK